MEQREDFENVRLSGGDVGGRDHARSVGVRRESSSESGSETTEDVSGEGDGGGVGGGDVDHRTSSRSSGGEVEGGEGSDGGGGTGLNDKSVRR